MYGLDELPPCDVEPNVFYEPRTAVAPFAVLKDVYRDAENSSMDYWAGPFKTREKAEEEARDYASRDDDGCAYYVIGCVSVSSRPTPVKASTRALV